MKKSTNKKKSSFKKILLVFVLSIISLIATFYLYNFIADRLDQNRFNQLDTQMQKLFEELKTVSNGTEDWKYKKECKETFSQYSGRENIIRIV